MFRILPPTGESSSITTNSYGNTAGIMRRRPQGEDSSLLPRTPPRLRSHLVASLAEFVGTFMYLLCAFTMHLTAVATATPDKPPTILVVLTICVAYAFFYGFWLLVYVLTLPGVVPGMFNPAIALGSVFVGGLSATRAVFLLPIQVLAGICAAAAVKALLPGDTTRIETVLAPSLTVVQGFFIEMVMTILVVIIALVVTARSGALSFMAPTGIAIALFFATFLGIGYTGASMNPIRSFSLCAVNSNFPYYHWIYWAGPIVGALLPSAYCRLMELLVPQGIRGEDAAEEGRGKPTEKSDPPGDHGVPEEQTRMIPQAPTPPKIRKTTTTRVAESSSPGGQKPNHRSDADQPAYYEKDDQYGPYYPSGVTTPPRSPYRSSREERRVSSGRHSDMDRYARARGTMFKSWLTTALLAGSALAYDQLLGFNGAAEVETRSIDEIYQAALKEGGVVTLWLGGDERTDEDALKRDFQDKFPGVTLNLTTDLSKYHSVRFDEQLAANNVYVDSIALQTVRDFPRSDAEGALLHYAPNGFQEWNTKKLPTILSPEQWEDWLRPEFKDKLVLTWPNDDDAVLYAFDLVMQQYGVSWFNRLLAQNPQWVRGTRTPDTIINSTNSTRAASFTSDALLNAEKSHKPLNFTYPTQGSFVTWFQLAAIPKDAPHPEGAKLLHNYFLSKEWQATRGSWPVRRDVPGPGGFLSIFDMSGTNITYFQEWMEDRGRVERPRTWFEDRLGTPQGLSPIIDGI
ncbi:Aquaporin-1 [Cercospora zeina]